MTERKLAPRSSYSKCCLVLSAGLMGAVAAAPAYAETRSYVVSYLTLAMHSEEGDCPGGPNPNINEQYRASLDELGIPSKEIDEELDKTINSSPNSPLQMRARIDGKPVNAFRNPAAAKDPHLKTLTGKYALGFNLDGRGAASPNSFEDPETHERGVNNELVRALGCFQSFRAKLPERPTFQLLWWGIVQESSPAWLMTIDGADLSKDGDVTVIFDRALEHVSKDANSEARADMTYRIDPNPVNHNVVRGTIKNGVLTTNESINFRMQSDPMVNPLFELHRMKMRLMLSKDDKINGIIGGYQPWRPAFFAVAINGPNVEYMISTNYVGLYWSLRRLADAEPDPKTGINSAISAAYSIQAIPAFIAPAEPAPISAK